MSDERLFDLNIEKILEGWEDSHAIRELVANAVTSKSLAAHPTSRSSNAKTALGSFGITDEACATSISLRTRTRRSSATLARLSVVFGR